MSLSIYQNSELRDVADLLRIAAVKAQSLMDSTRTTPVDGITSYRLTSINDHLSQANVTASRMSGEVGLPDGSFSGFKWHWWSDALTPEVLGRTTNDGKTHTLKVQQGRYHKDRLVNLAHYILGEYQVVDFCSSMCVEFTRRFINPAYSGEISRADLKSFTREHTTEAE